MTVADKMVKESFERVGDHVSENVDVGVDVVGSCSTSSGNTFAAFTASTTTSTSLDDRADIDTLDTKVGGYVVDAKAGYSRSLRFSNYWTIIS